MSDQENNGNSQTTIVKEIPKNNLKGYIFNKNKEGTSGGVGITYNDQNDK